MREIEIGREERERRIEGKKTHLQKRSGTPLSLHAQAGNFVDLAAKKFYDGMEIQRADGFVVQTVREFEKVFPSFSKERTSSGRRERERERGGASERASERAREGKGGEKHNSFFFSRPPVEKNSSKGKKHNSLFLFSTPRTFSPLPRKTKTNTHPRANPPTTRAATSRTAKSAPSPSRSW